MNNLESSENHGMDKRTTHGVKRLHVNPPADQDLAATAVNAIECLTTIPPEMIKVTAHKDWLRLEGTVNWGDQRTTLEQVTGHLPGVQGVIDSIRIQPLASTAIFLSCRAGSENRLF